MRLDITLTPNDKQVARLEKVMARINATRTSFTSPLPAYPSILEWLQDECDQLMKNHIESQKERERQNIRSAYSGATEAQQAQIDAILGLT